MQKSDPRYGAYVRVLEAHLKPAMGCTEPIAIAYAAAVAARALGKCSLKIGNIFLARSYALEQTNSLLFKLSQSGLGVLILFLK